MKINILDKKVYNRIAAGEVVERPFSVIKELVENSVDAGAKNISVYVYNGGKDRMIIEDDGCGIEKDEMPKAFLPHATSKISDIGDLENIITLGFRGEALASIASVAKVSIVSKPEDQDFGASIYAEGGNIGEVSDAPSPNGTRITVDDLFFNTPVRAKFLKTARAEEGDITNMICRLVLANPDIAFTYYVDDKQILQSYGGGEEEAMLAVYGAAAVRNCFKISTVKNGIGIRGYIGRHNFTKPNRTYQTLIINGRYVINSTVSSAVQNAYQAYLMKRQYPFFVLELNMPSGTVDVNVHPNKTDVRFSNNQVVYGAVYSVVSKVLDGSNEALDIVSETPSDITGETVIPQAVSKKRETLNETSTDVPFPEVSSDDSDKGEFEIIEDKKGFVPLNPAEGRFSEKPVKGRKPAVSREMKEFWQFAEVGDSGSEDEKKREEDEKRANDIFNENKRYLEELERKASKSREPAITSDVKRSVETVSSEKITAENEMPNDTPEQKDMGFGYEFVYVGQAFKTYLIFEKNGDLYFVDQHAAHERLLFDAIYANATDRNAATQPLLIPFILSLNSVEDGYFRTRIPYLEELGFKVEEFGRNTYKISEVPLDIADISLEAFFGDILNDNSLKQEKIPDIIREKLCQRACKAAIKAGYELSEGEIKSLIHRMKGDMGLKCPHGRPVAVRITRTEMEKWFKRIV